MQLCPIFVTLPLSLSLSLYLRSKYFQRFWNTLNQYSSRSVKEKDSHPHKNNLIHQYFIQLMNKTVTII